MKERPILFSAPMVRAILAGTKTQTRRVVKDTHIVSTRLSSEDRHSITAEDTYRCPYGQPSERLWVRETWMECGLTRRGLALRAYYAADGHQYFDPSTSPPTKRKWRPSIHMPRWASRILLEVVSVRAERLNDISEANAEAEGSREWSAEQDTPVRDMQEARLQFMALWESINGPGSWDANPWVWVVEFKRIEGGAA